MSQMNDKCILNDLRDYTQDKIRCSSSHCTAMTLLHLNCGTCIYFMSNKTNVRHRCIYVNWKVK